MDVCCPIATAEMRSVHRVRAGTAASGDTGYQHGRLGNAGWSVLAVIISISAKRERWQRKLLNIRCPELADAFLYVWYCIFRHDRDVHGQCKCEQSCRWYLWPSHYYFCQFRYRPRHYDRDRDPHRQSASAASHPCKQHFRFGDAWRPVLGHILPLHQARRRANGKPHRPRPS